ncbi:hypothetical protein ABT352_04175, partial [Streptosporangium sp. NPDC000563]|uniref:hypothetical protein n=1 Tax=Streptosporangium sp. NPDC000563 TaxID=3154366 RepID=UPI00332232AC
GPGTRSRYAVPVRGPGTRSRYAVPVRGPGTRFAASCSEAANRPVRTASVRPHPAALSRILAV